MVASRNNTELGTGCRRESYDSQRASSPRMQNQGCEAYERLALRNYAGVGNYAYI